MPGMKVTANVDGKTATLQLTENEVVSGLSICDRAGIESVIVMKKHNGGALFFTNENHAANAQERQGYDYSFMVEAKDLRENAPKPKSAGNPKNGG